MVVTNAVRLIYDTNSSFHNTADKEVICCNGETQYVYG